MVIWLLNTCARLSVMSVSFQAFSFEYMYMATRAARIFDLDLTACFLPSLVAFVFVLCFFFCSLGYCYCLTVGCLILDKCYFFYS